MNKAPFTSAPTMSLLQQKVHTISRIIVVFLLTAFLLLRAEDFSYTFHIDNKTPYVKEAVIFTLDLNQTNPNIVLLFNFDLVKNDNYHFQRLDSKETDDHETKGLHHAQIHYTYLIYPLQSGTLDIAFTLVKKVTTDESIAYSFSGDRDNIKTLVTTDTDIVLPALTLTVKALPEDTQIVGDFTLDYHIKKHQAEAHEPIPFQVILKGLGYPPLLNTLLPKDVNFTVFTEKPLVHTVASTQGTHSTVTYPIALSHSQSFTLPSISLNAFNPQIQKTYTLTLPAQHFDIKELEISNLVDKVNSPEMLKTDFSWLKNLFSYVLIFTAGYLTALLGKRNWIKSKHNKAIHPLKEKIQKCKDTKALLQILLAHDSHRFAPVITALESSLYGDDRINTKKITFKALKEKAMELL